SRWAEVLATASAILRIAFATMLPTPTTAALSTARVTLFCIVNLFYLLFSLISFRVLSASIAGLVKLLFFHQAATLAATVSALVTSASMVLSSMGSTGLPIALSTMLMRASARQMVRTMVPVEMFSLSIDFQSSLAQRLNFAQRYRSEEHTSELQSRFYIV